MIFCMGWIIVALTVVAAVSIIANITNNFVISVICIAIVGIIVIDITTTTNILVIAYITIISNLVINVYRNGLDLTLSVV